MKTLLVLKDTEKKIFTFRYFRSEKEALDLWNSCPHKLNLKLIYLKERQKSGHRYELMYGKFNKYGEIHSWYIICFSKKEALYLKTKISEINSNYFFDIKKLY